MQRSTRLCQPGNGISEKCEDRCSRNRGLDHAAWAILRHMYPGAKIPVFALSLDYSFNDWNPKPVMDHYKLAQDLAAIREKGVLIIGSGNIVHNLGLIDYRNIDARPYDWAIEFDEKVKFNLVNRNHEALINYRSMTRSANLAVPTLDHYLPLIYAIALQEKNESLKFTYEGFQHGSVSMRCFQIG